MGVKVDMSGVPIKLARVSTNAALGAYASTQAARLMEPFVPMDTGALIESAGTSTPWIVTYDTPYARRQYYGVNHDFNHEKHPKARARWDEGPDWQELGDLLTEKLRSM